MRLNWSRRDFLSGIGVAGLVGIAGCPSGGESNRGATDVILHNEAGVSRTVDVTVTQRDSESSAIDTSAELGPHSQEKINNKVIMDSDYNVEITYTDSTDESPYTEILEWDDAGPPLHVILNDQIVFAVQVG